MLRPAQDYLLLHLSILSAIPCHSGACMALGPTLGSFFQAFPLSPFLFSVSVKNGMSLVLRVDKSCFQTYSYHFLVRYPGRG